MKRTAKCLRKILFILCTEVQIKAAFANKESVQRELRSVASQRVCLSCEVNDTKAEVKWYKDGKLLTFSKTVHAESKGKTRQLVIESVETKDGGEYMCEVGGDKLFFKIHVEGKANAACRFIRHIWRSCVHFFFYVFVKLHFL